jgi:enoyl-[acyl-carrier protein] reductase/trans-2-enoyl-CoA reductase (NAD+)
MVIKPKVRDFICTTAHPDGCREYVKKQIDNTKQQEKIKGFKKVLVIGGSTGYGLATRIAATYAYGADTLSVMFEKSATERRTATPGWYNTEVFEEIASADGYYAKSINGDAFSKEIKEQTIAQIKEDLGQVDLVVYSLAAPRRTVEDGTTYRSVLKTVDEDFTNKSLDLRTNTISQATIISATEEEIHDTIKVMGGEDWKEWIEVLEAAGVLAKEAVTIAYSYIGPKLTYPVYFNGTIGLAKKHLYQTSIELNEKFKEQGIKAYISVNKALVTQASSAIPIVPLYMAVLYKIMKEEGLHEGCIEQMNRLFREKLKNGQPIVDEEGRIRLDDYEMRTDIQDKVMEYWNQIDSDNIREFADIDGYWEDFYHMFGFGFDEVDYERDVILL